uniref:DUF642 domain-containing protein n=1 Tax=Leersia perrieri TaxID=77586 RepID=A0A0D9WWQ2_9ORYZ
MELMVGSFLLLLLPLSSSAAPPPPPSSPPPPRPHVQTTVDGVLVNGNFAMSPRKMNATVIVGRDSLPGWALTGHVEYSVAVRPGAAYALTFAATRTCDGEEAAMLRVSVSPSFTAPAVVPVHTLYGAAAADVWAWGFRAAEKDAQIVFTNPAAAGDAACGPLLAVVVIKELPSPLPSKDNLIRNGDFKIAPPAIPNSTAGVLLPPNQKDATSPLPGWIVEKSSLRLVDAPHSAVPRGRRGVELVAGRDGAIAQVIRTEKGRAYGLSFAVGDAGDGCEGEMVVRAVVDAGNATAAAVHYVSRGDGGGAARRGGVRFVARGRRTRVTFYSAYYHTSARDGVSPCGPVVDDVRVQPLMTTKA